MIWVFVFIPGGEMFHAFSLTHSSFVTTTIFLPVVERYPLSQLALYTLHFHNTIQLHQVEVLEKRSVLKTSISPIDQPTVQVETARYRRFLQLFESACYVLFYMAKVTRTRTRWICLCTEGNRFSMYPVLLESNAPLP